MKLLLAHGADPNLPNMHGITPVMAAAGLGSNEIDTRGRFKTEAEAVETIKLLVKAGADVNAHETRGGQTALHGAALWGCNDVVKTLGREQGGYQCEGREGHAPRSTPRWAAPAATAAAAPASRCTSPRPRSSNSWRRTTNDG